MKILLLSNSYPLSSSAGGGAALFPSEMALTLCRTGAKLCVVTPDRAGEKCGDPQVLVRWFPWSGRNEDALIKLRVASISGIRHAASLFCSGRRAVLDACREFAPDICLAAWALPSGYFARHAKRRLGVPYAVWCLGSDIHTWAKKPLVRGLTRRILRDADLLYADGFALGKDVTSLCGRPCEFLATSRSLSDVPLGQMACEPGKTHFLYVGRWESVKGLDVLIDAWRLLAEAGQAESAVLHVAGHGKGLESYVHAAASEPRLNRSVRITGWLSDEQLAGLYRAVDCVVISSRSESIPIVLSEAIQAGTPLIVTDVGDMGCLVRRYSLGHVVPSESPVALKDAIKTFIAKRHTVAPKMFAEARRLFDVEQTAQRFLADAAEVVGKGGGPRAPIGEVACEGP